MAIGVSGGNNPIDFSNLFKNAGVAPKNQPEQVSSTGTETRVDDTASKAERLRAEILGADVFGTAGPNTVAKTAGANSIASSTIKFNENITATSALGQSSSVEAIGGPEVVAATTNDNARLKLETTKLANLANKYNARTVDGDFFDVSAENTSLADNNTALAAARG